MKIIVLMKQVANKDAILRINKDSTWIEEADLSFEVNESDGYALEESLRVKRELESGWYQWYTMPKPALLTIQSGISQIRYATLKGIMAAKKKEIKEVA